METFSDKFLEKYLAKPTPLCIGLDPHLESIPETFHQGSMEVNDPRTIQTVFDFLISVLDLCSGMVHVVKPQSAFFELFGWRGYKCMEDVSSYAKSKGFLVILDAKRGDIGSTANAYAQAYLTENSPFDALTINPYLGVDSLLPFVHKARISGKGIFVLVKTSNVGSSDFQNLSVGTEKLYDSVAGRLAPLAAELLGDSGWSSLGVVVGATCPEDALKIRGKLPNSLFLIPGYGAQGGSAKEASVGFVDRGRNVLEGGIINSSRKILFPTGVASSIKEWRSAVVQAISASNADLIKAIKVEQ